jgi:eukaryotic-like serine/threonine-protein kinase
VKLPARYTPTGKDFAGGGMSTTIVCHDSHLDRDVLVKALEKGVDQKRITDELNALSSIRSKHVVEIYDAIRDEHGNVIAIVEELITGDDLNSKFPVTDAHLFLKYLYAIACGLSDIHAIKRVHRDIKPGNMKFDDENVLRIFDFGLSRTESDASTIGTWGTPGYLAPELCVAPDEKVNFTPAVDTFAFGATAVKMIKGKLSARLKKVPPDVPCPDADFSKLGLTLPGPVADVLNACLAKDPKDRPEMAEVRDTIGSYLVQGKHKATIVTGGLVYILDAKNRTVKLTGPGSAVTIQYDDTDFVITGVTGSVSVNRVPATIPHRLPGSCVLIFSSPSGRSFASVDISYPEVVV